MATEGMDSKDRFDASDWLQPTASAQSLFWQPNFVANSELLQHLPFLFWAIETIRPQDAAVIGVGEGVGHFGICQAFDELTLPGCCRGFGFWGATDSREQFGPVPENLITYNAAHYDDISALMACRDVVEAVETIPEHSLDLLLIDLESSPAFASPLPPLWLARLKKRGLLILHGSNRLESQKTPREFWGQLVGNAPSIRFNDGQGLTLALIGDHPPSDLLQMIGHSSGDIPPPEVHRVFHRLGKGLMFQASTAQARKESALTAKTLATTRRQVLQTMGALEELREAYDLRSRSLAETQALLFDHTIDKASAQQERTHRFRETAELTRMLEEQAASSKREITGLKSELSSSVREIEALKHEVTLLKREVVSLERVQATTESELTTREKALVATQAQLARCNARCEALLSSTSWKLTAPIRKIKNPFHRS